MSRIEYITPEGLREDGRRPNELRRIKSKLGIFSRASGSAYYEQGNTKVIAVVYGPREVSKRMNGLHDRATITCEYSMASFSTGERKKKNKGDRRGTEISSIIKQTFESVILTSLFPKSQIDIFIQVLQADGGTRCASINAASLALIDAGIPMKDFVCACAAGCIEGTPILDLNYVEDSAGGPDVPVALLPRTGTIAMLQMDSKVSIDLFEKVLDLAVEGCKAIHTVLSQAVLQHTTNLATSRGSVQPA
eukprot:TRINITY_DN15305_c0_g1_i1.p1 TRINITY_DN15305_c0_g1~~TRINITY_DN15305_c0_g1_i1.p1  ORF type:complete len:249 (-),score=99.92 TRINITY_DN15305_c0_g1_i1:54-800(-)